jgi:hypothetical protein
VAVSCHRDHAGDARVSWGDQARYLRDEAWFLPRLHACAVRAGIAADAPEMGHLSRWAFMRARQLAVMGESELARDLLALARQCSGVGTAEMRLVALSASLIGWRATGILCQGLERLRRNRKPAPSAPIAA